MNIKEVEKAVARIKASLFKNSNSYAIGMLKSHFRGTGLQFKEHQIYTFGDDVRFIDWKLLAKTRVPYIKTFEEERNVEIAVVIDASQSMMMGYKNVSKLQASIEICCLLYLLAKETGDSVHAIIVSDTIVDIPKLSGEKGIVALVSNLERAGILDNEGKVNIDYTFENKVDEKEIMVVLMKHLARNREVVLLSDFYDFLDRDVLKKIFYRSRVHGFKVLSPLDEARSLPYSLFVRKNMNDSRGSLSRVEVEKNNQEEEEFFGKALKKLRVKDRYLEDFIKEML